jgi:hypothetical protein
MYGRFWKWFYVGKRIDALVINIEIDWLFYSSVLLLHQTILVNAILPASIILGGSEWLISIIIPRIYAKENRLFYQPYFRHSK